MDNQKIIIVLLCIIAAILVVGIAMVTTLGKESSKIEFDGNSISAGDSLHVKLTGAKGNPIGNETVSIKLKNKDGGSDINENIVTDSDGNANLKIDEKGHYDVEVSFSGNAKFSSSSASGSVNVSEATTKLVGEDKTSTATHASKYAPNGGIYPEYGPEVDSYGVTREYAIAHNMHYLELDLGDEVIGGYTAIDPNTGTYHT